MVSSQVSSTGYLVANCKACGSSPWSGYTDCTRYSQILFVNWFDAGLSSCVGSVMKLLVKDWMSHVYQHSNNKWPQSLQITSYLSQFLDLPEMYYIQEQCYLLFKMSKASLFSSAWSFLLLQQCGAVNYLICLLTLQQMYVAQQF